MSKFPNFLISVIFISLDQITKAIFAHRDFFIGPIHFAGKQNYFLPFGLNFGNLTNSIILVAGALVFLWFAIFYFGSRTKFPIILILAGALSNILDRIIFGYVRDFIDSGLAFTFNFADILIFSGLVWFLFIDFKRDPLEILTSTSQLNTKNENGPRQN